MHPSTELKTRINWRADETAVLLKSWRNHQYINRLIKKGCSKHPLYFAISKDLQKAGFDRSVKEIAFKMRNLTAKLNKAKRCLAANEETNFRYFEEVDEILKMEEVNVAASNIDEMEPEQPEMVFDESVVEGIASEKVRVIRLDVPNQQPEHDHISESDPQSYTVISHAEPEEQHESEVIHISLPEAVAMSSSSRRTPENILLAFYQEFERSNQQLEKNDAAMLELFKEQNDIFRTQTTLLMKLLLK